MISPQAEQELSWFLNRARPARVRSLREFAESEIIIPDGPFAGRRFRCDRQLYTRLWFEAIDSGPWNRFVAILLAVFGVGRLNRDRWRVVIQPETLTCEDDRPLIAKQKPGVTGADKRGGPRVPDRSNSPLVLSHSLGVSRSGPGNGRLFALKCFPRRLQLAADLTDPSRSHVEQLGGRLGRFADGQKLGNLSLPWGEYIQMNTTALTPRQGCTRSAADSQRSGTVLGPTA